MFKILVGLLLAALVTPPAGFAQTFGTDARDAAIRIRAAQFPAGTLNEAVNRESIRLAALTPAVRPQPRARSWPGRHPVLFGALVGLGAGLAVEAAVIPGESGGEPYGAYLPMFGCLGAGIGSLTGLMVSVVRR